MRTTRGLAAGAMLAAPAAPPFAARGMGTWGVLRRGPLRPECDARLFAWLDTTGTGLYIVWNDTNHTGSLDRTGITAGAKRRHLVVKYSRLLNLTG